MNGTAFTDFNPATWPATNGGTLTGSANGEGSLTYPGADGPVASVRLVNIADGIEGDATKGFSWLITNIGYDFAACTGTVCGPKKGIP